MTQAAADDPLLVLLPGLDGTEVFFRPLLAQLPPQIRTLVLSLPDRGPYGYDGLESEIRRHLEGLPAYYLLAASFSGPLAVRLAAAQPERVRGLILVATFLRAPKPCLVPLRFAIRAPLVWTLRLLRRLPVWLLHRRGDAVREAKNETWRRTSARALAGRARAVLTVDVRNRLAGCCVPLLCVAYAADRVVPRHYTREILASQPAGRYAVLAGGHLGMFTHARDLARCVAEFIGADTACP